MVDDAAKETFPLYGNDDRNMQKQCESNENQATNVARKAVNDNTGECDEVTQAII